MFRKRPVIQEKVIIASIASPIGEALRGDDPIPNFPMAPSEREDMVERLEKSISELMVDAENMYQVNCYIPGTTEIDPDYIARLSTHEFFFYTREPLTLQEFEELQNKIAMKAENLSPGVQLILGSFAVKTDDNKVMNVTPHISCGKPSSVHFIVKSYTSSIDVRYKIPDGQGDTNTLAVLDVRNPPNPMPKIIISGVAKEYTFDNIVHCKTPGGTPFLTAIDICLDHAYGVAKNNYKHLVKKTPAIIKQPISHVVVSNWIEINRAQCLGSSIMHVDPVCSPKKCKEGISQQSDMEPKLAFGNGLFRVFKLACEKLYHPIDKVFYAYRVSDFLDGRNHKFYTVSLSNINFQKSQATTEFNDFKKKYQLYKGDYLKTQILENLRERIQETGSKEKLHDLKKQLKTSYEYDVLRTGQGWFTRMFGIKTSSIKTLDNMFEQQEKYLSLLDLP